MYYLGPDKSAARRYHLLREALQATGRVALANYAVRGKSQLVLIRPMHDGIVMEQLKHQDELRSFGDVPLEDMDIGEEMCRFSAQESCMRQCLPAGAPYGACGLRCAPWQGIYIAGGTRLATDAV